MKNEIVFKDIEAVKERFYSGVAEADENGCRVWTRGRDKAGYGQFYVAGTAIPANRMALFLRDGVWPDQACHHCDNPPCVADDHLFNGTHAENMADAARKKRMPGKANKLTARDVVLLRELMKDRTLTVEEIAWTFGISVSHCYRVAKGGRWSKFVPMEAQNVEESV